MTIGNSIGTTQGFSGPTGAAIAFVSEGWDFFEEKVNRYSQLTLDLINQLSYVPRVQPVEFNIDFPDITGLTAFHAPTRPALPAIDFQPVAVPTAPDLQLPLAPAMAGAPTFDVPAPLPISLPVQPGTLDIVDPGEAPALTTLVLPDAPTITLPDLPVLFDILIPEAPTPQFPTFDAVAPRNVPALPNLAGTSFTETPYTPALLDQITPVIRSGLAGGQILSLSIEQAMFGRARERVNKVSRAAMQAIDEEFSGRGFKRPPGAWAAARSEQRSKNQDAINDANRDLTIQLHTKALESVKDSIVQGIGLEQVLIAQHGQVQDRALQACRLLLDTHVALFNADVARFNGEVQAFQANASVFHDLITAEVSKLEVYKAQVDGQRATADVNKAISDAYDSRVRGLLSIAQMYTAQVAGVQAQADIEKTRIEGYRARVQGYAERVGLYTAQWGGYKSAVEAQQAGFRNYEIGVGAYAARVNAWAEGERTKSGRYETDLKASGLRFDGYRARIQEVVARLQVEEGRVNALSTQSEAIARMYQADGVIESARNDANTRAFQAAVEYATNRSSAQLREAEIKIQDAARLLNAQLEAIKGAAGALAQLTASAMSAVNFSAGVNGSGSESSSWGFSRQESQSINWQGETPDLTNPTTYF